MLKLKDWLRKDGVGIWVLIVAIMIPALAIDASQSRLPRFLRLAAFAIIVARISKWWKRLLAYGIIVILSGFIAAYQAGPYPILTSTPPPSGPAIDEVVVLGGDAMWYWENDRQTALAYITATVCFYTEDGWGVAVAHATEVPMDASISVSGGNGDGYTGAGKVAGKTDLGLVLAEMKPPPQRERMRIAQPDEIRVGAEAIVHAPTGDIVLTVEGFIDQFGVTELVLLVPSQEYPIGPGMSGSPITQNGKIIAFLKSTIGYKKGQFTHAPLATDIYRYMSEVRRELGRR